MSRIHEALQRAYLERGKAQVASELQIATDLQAASDLHFAEPDNVPVTAVLDPEPIGKAEIEVDKIARHPWSPSIASFPTLADRGASVEQFRGLRSHIYQARYEAPLKSILIASGMPNEGKSFVAANLAMSLARNTIHNVLLIDADLRMPTLHTLLGAPNTVGLTDYLGGTAEMFDVMQRDQDQGKGEDGTPKNIENLTLIPSGKSTDHSTELVASERMKELIDRVSPYFDWIIIDAPPVMAVTDAVEISHAADAVLLIARSAATPYEVAQRTQAAFASARILGYVLNDVKEVPKKGSYSYNYDYYQQGGSEGNTRSN